MEVVGTVLLILLVSVLVVILGVRAVFAYSAYADSKKVDRGKRRQATLSKQYAAQHYQLPTRCPQCRAGDIYKVSDVYKQGITTGSAHGNVFIPGHSGHAGHLAPVAMQTRQQSALSNQLTPPNGEYGIPISLGLAMPLGYGGGMCFFSKEPQTILLGWLLILLAITIFVGYFVSAIDKAKYVPTWSRLWYCARCGCVFDPATSRFSANGNPNELY